MRQGTPLVVIVAGPNGAGKSTSAPRLLQGALSVQEFVNADAIALGLSGFHPERVAIPAGRAMLLRMRHLAEVHADFAVETTLAGRTLLPFVQKLLSDGWRAHLVFVSLAHSDLAVSRVAERVRRGGHDVPEATVRRRFVAGLQHFFDSWQALAIGWRLFDNSLAGAPRLVAHREAGAHLIVLDAQAWTNLRRQADLP